MYPGPSNLRNRCGERNRYHGGRPCVCRHQRTTRDRYLWRQTGMPPLMRDGDHHHHHHHHHLVFVPSAPHFHVRFEAAEHADPFESASSSSSSNSSTVAVNRDAQIYHRFPQAASPIRRHNRDIIDPTRRRRRTRFVAAAAMSSSNSDTSTSPSHPFDFVAGQIEIIAEPYLVRLIEEYAATEAVELARILESLDNHNRESENRSKPASKSAIEAMPIRKFAPDAENTTEECAVCTEPFVVGEQVREMPCRHLYHSACILPWLALHDSCPVCRHQLIPPSDSEEAVPNQERHVVAPQSHEVPPTILEERPSPAGFQPRNSANINNVERASTTTYIVPENDVRASRIANPDGRRTARNRYTRNRRPCSGISKLLATMARMAGNAISGDLQVNNATRRQQEVVRNEEQQQQKRGGGHGWLWGSRTCRSPFISRGCR